MGQLDLPLVTSRLTVCQELSRTLTAIEPPEWSRLIAEHVRRLGCSAAVLDVEAEGIGRETSSRQIADTDARLVGYSQRACDALPLRTERLTASEGLDFRDRTFEVHFLDSTYLAMVEDRFGPAVVGQIRDMPSVKFRRRHDDSGYRNRLSRSAG